MYRIEAVAFEHGEGEQLCCPEFWDVRGEWETADEAWEEARRALQTMRRVPDGREWFARVVER